MNLPADYHIHTKLCNHAEGELEEYLTYACKIGLTEIGISDHAPMPEDNFDSWRMKKSELDYYIKLIETAKSLRKELTIKIGIEVDYIPGMEEWINTLSSYYPWDYIIGSVHYVNEWDIDNPQKLDMWDKADVLDVWQQYVERLVLAVNSGLFDIIGHIDLPKKFGHKPLISIEKLFSPFFSAIQKNRIAIEINTSGLRKPCNEIYPSKQLLRLAALYNINVTFGSDAHAPSEVGYKFEIAIKDALEAGLTHWLKFQKRSPFLVPIKLY